MSEAQLSILRSVLKVVGTLIVAHGGLKEADLPGLQIAIEGIAGGALGLWGFWLSHRKHAATDEQTKPAA